MDVHTPEQRARNMAAIRSKDTKPELAVRKMLHGMGYRFSLHREDLPGRPDIVLRRYRTVVLVHSCFFHRHERCRCTTTPKTNVEFWERKFRQNVERDRRVREALTDLGWLVLTVWTCEAKDPDQLRLRLATELQRRLTQSQLGSGRRDSGDQRTKGNGLPPPPSIATVRPG